MTKQAGGVGETANCESASEPIDGGSQVLRGYRSAKSGVSNARALEVLTFPCGGVSVGDRLRTRVRCAEKLFHAIIEELCSDTVRIGEGGHIGHGGERGVEGSYDV